MPGQVRAFASARRACPPLFEAVGTEVQQRARDFSDLSLGHTALAFAEAGHSHPAVFAAVEKEARTRPRDAPGVTPCFF